jgi:hypothetical protein
MSNIFDSECYNRYGPKTCLLVETQKNIYKLRLLDNANCTKEYVQKSAFYEFIPLMLMQRYTVVIVEKFEKIDEITAIHLPVQSQLNTPPIIQ